ncbi:sulfite reductase subunit alpha [Roseomonas sp. SSH11]|uniref:Sulfite reductase subunit alpha n=1 Tax=Pararoseomonas baculiformis TaxID=2820812 RepID=A0ABS4AL87_9PROT|nr:sulfite reductase subunit alpha [Pararoseomonas baculiformis]MBP0447641.1 sulfite reductase subunit alpha [Pararoseomonas baculiformis]
MNAISPIAGAFPQPAPVPLIPENAPFTAEQRAWLNGFLAGLYGRAALPGTAAAPASEPEEEFPWHDPALGLDERLAMAAGKPLSRRYMAAMAQLDCGQCGYVCKTYAEAIATGAEGSLSLCVPGGKATQKALKALQAEAPAAAHPAPAAKPAGPALVPVRLLAADRLSGEGSTKDVRNLVLDLEGTGLRYEPGDSLGLLAPNNPALVEACLSALGATGEEPVPCPDGIARPVQEAFLAHLAIARPLDRTLDLLAGAARDPKEAAMLRRLVDGEDNARPEDADLLDLLEHFPSARPSLADLAASLPGLKPRLYSIASSPLAMPGKVELCVSVVQAERRGRVRQGVASCHLGFRGLEAPMPAYMQVSHFRLPDDPNIPIIMCGPGTGIAPFRAFLQHRAAQGIMGRTWLFFGDQTSSADYLFRPEIEGWLADGTLERLSLAWSRDPGTAKVYVQDRMKEQAADLWRWFQDGARFYICGDASRMAKDVDATLREIAIREGRMDADAARDWIVALARQNRYQRDVY